MKPTASTNAKSRTAKRAKAGTANVASATAATTATAATATTATTAATSATTATAITPTAGTPGHTIPVPVALTTLKDAYLAEPLQRDTTTAQPLAEALTDFFAQLLPDTERKSLFTLTKFCLMELTLIKLARAGKEE